MMLRVLGLSFLAAAFALVGACSDDEQASDDDADDDASTTSSSGGKSSSSSSGGKSSSSGGSSSSSSGGASSGGSSSGGSSSGDASPESDAACTQSPATLDAGSYCGAYDFRKPPVAKSPVDADGGSEWTGGALTAGTYDAVRVEWNGSPSVTIQETLVLDGAGRYTRIRQLVTDGNAGPVTRRAGAYSTDDEQHLLTFADDCRFSGDTSATPETQSVSYDVILDECGVPALRYGASGIRVTLKQH